MLALRSRRQRVRRCRSRRYRPDLLVLKVPAFGLMIRGRRGAHALTVLLIAADAGWGAGTGRLDWGLLVGCTLVAGWALFCLRLLRLTMVGPEDRRPPGGTAGVREPRRPRPRPPAGSMALALPADPPDEAAAFA